MSSSKKGKSKGKDITSQIFTSATEALPSAPRFGVGNEGGHGGYNRNGGRGGYANQYPARSDNRGSAPKEINSVDLDWKRGSNSQPPVQGRVSAGGSDIPQRNAQPQKSLNDYEWVKEGKTQPQPSVPNTSLTQRNNKEITPQKSLNDYEWVKEGKAQPQPQIPPNTSLSNRDGKDSTTAQHKLDDYEWKIGGKAQPELPVDSSLPHSHSRENNRVEQQQQHKLDDYEWKIGGKAQPELPVDSTVHHSSSSSSSSHSKPLIAHNTSSIVDMDWSRKESQPPPPPPSSSSSSSYLPRSVSIDNPPSSSLPSSSSDNNNNNSSSSRGFHHSKSLHVSEKRELDWSRKGIAQPKMEDNNNNRDNEEWTSVGPNGKPRRYDFRRNDNNNNDNYNRNDGKRLLTREGMKGRDILRRDNNYNNNSNESNDKKEIEKPVIKQEEVKREEEKPVEKEKEKEIKEEEKPEEKKPMPSLEELKERAKKMNQNNPSTFLEPASKKQTNTPNTPNTANTTGTTSTNTPSKANDKPKGPTLEELKERARQMNQNNQSAFLSKPMKELSKLFYYSDINTFEESRKRRIHTSISELITNRKNDDTIEDIKELKLKEIEKVELIKEIIMDLCDYNKPEEHKLIYELINKLYKDKLVSKCDIFCGLSIINNNKEDLKCDIPKIDDYYTEIYKYLSKNELIDYKPMSKDSKELDSYYSVNKYFNELKGEELTEKLINENLIENAVIIFEIFICHLISISNNSNDDDDDADSSSNDNKPVLSKEYEGVYTFPLLDDDNKYGNVLKRLIGNVNSENISNIKEVQLKCIDIGCKYCNLLNNPTEWCESLFMNLYDKYVISEDSFKDWKNSSVIEEKDRIMKDCEDFFEWLETAEYED